MDHAAAMMLRLQVGAGGKEVLRRQLEGTHGSVTDEQLEDVWAILTDRDGPPIELSVAGHVGHMIELSEELVKYLVGRPWVLVKFGRRSLLTSDDPVGLVDDPDDEPFMGVGFMTARGITFPLTRKLGLLMANLELLIEANIPVERVHEGGFDTVEFESTKFEKFFNQHTVHAASRWIFHHPDDARFVPDDLPDEKPYSMQMGGADVDFTGESWFAPATGGPSEGA